MNTAIIMDMMFNTEMIVKDMKGGKEDMTEKRFKVAVYDDKAINGFAVLDLQKPNSSKRLEYENVYIGSKAGCEIVCNFGNNLAEENEQLKQFKTRTFEILKHNIQEASEWKKLDMSNSEKRRLQFLESILIGIERELQE